MTEVAVYLHIVHCCCFGVFCSSTRQQVRCFLRKGNIWRTPTQARESSFASKPMGVPLEHDSRTSAIQRNVSRALVIRSSHQSLSGNTVDISERHTTATRATYIKLPLPANNAADCMKVSFFLFLCRQAEMAAPPHQNRHSLTPYHQPRPVSPGGRQLSTLKYSFWTSHCHTKE